MRQFVSRRAGERGAEGGGGAQRVGDQETLGRAAFGPGKQARALLIDHKDAVIRFLLLLECEPRVDGEVGPDVSE